MCVGVALAFGRSIIRNMPMSRRAGLPTPSPYPPLYGQWTAAASSHREDPDYVHLGPDSLHFKLSVRP